MNDIKLLIKRFKENELIAYVLYSRKCYRKLIGKLFFEVQILADNRTKILRKEINCIQILEPELLKYFKDDYLDGLDNIPVVSDTIKFRVPGHSINIISKITLLCKTEGQEIINKKEYFGEKLKVILNSNKYWRDFLGEKVSLFTNLSTNNNIKNLLNKIIEEVCGFCNLELRFPVQYYITNSILDIYGISRDFPITETNCLTAGNKVLVCLYSEKFLKNIITHETVHALLYQNYFIKKNNYLHWQTLCLEGYCQYVMNCLCKKKDSYIRFGNAIKNLYILDFCELKEKIFSENYDMGDIIIQYEILPYIFEKWNEESNLLSDILCNFDKSKIIERKINKYFNLAVEYIENKQILDLNKKYNNLYIVFFKNVKMVNDRKQYYKCVGQYRCDIEMLRYCDCVKEFL